MDNNNEQDESHNNNNLLNINFINEEQNSINPQIDKLQKSENDLLYYDQNQIYSSKCSFPEANLKKKKKIEKCEENNDHIDQVKTNRERLEEKAVYKGRKINSGGISYNSYNDGVGVHNHKTSISQYCQAMYYDELRDSKKRQQVGNITDLIRMNECNSNLWGFQRLDEDKKYDWVIEDIFIQNSWSANMGSGKSQMLGKGAFGNVIKVKDNNTQIPYALKFIKKSFFTKAITETDIMKQFHDEKHIIQYHDIYLYDQQTERNQVIEIQQYLVIVMELAQASLEDILKQRIACQTHWSTTELLKVIQHIAKALQSLALKNIVHRDIKPSNILYCQQIQQYKLADFGEAKLVEGINYEQPHTPRGTKKYMSPELLNGLVNSKQQQSSQCVIQPSNKSPIEIIKPLFQGNDQIDQYDEAFSKQFNYQFQQQLEEKIEIVRSLKNSRNDLKEENEKENEELVVEKDDLAKMSIEPIKKNELKPILSQKSGKKINKGNESKGVLYEPYSNDIYSLGVCFLQMKYLDDLSQYKGNEQKSLIQEIYLHSKLQEVDPIDKFIKKMIDFNPKNRPNINQVLDFIEQELSHISKQNDHEGIHYNYDPTSSEKLETLERHINDENFKLNDKKYFKKEDETTLRKNSNRQNHNFSNEEILKVSVNSQKQNSINQLSNENSLSSKNSSIVHQSFKNIQLNNNSSKNSSIVYNSSKSNSINNQCYKNINSMNQSPQMKQNKTKQLSEKAYENKDKSSSSKENDRIIFLEQEENFIQLKNNKLPEKNQILKQQSTENNQVILNLSHNQVLTSNSNQNIKQKSLTPSQQLKHNQKQEDLQVSSSQIIQPFFSNNDTYDNLRNQKIFIGSAKNHELNQKSYSDSESNLTDEDDVEDDESESEIDSDSDNNEEEEEIDEEENQKEDEINDSQDEDGDSDSEQMEREQINIQNKKQNKDQIKKRIKNRNEDIPQNLFEDCKDSISNENQRVESMENKVDEFYFLKLMETKRQNKLTITQKIQHIIARAQAYESLLKFQKARDTFQELYEKHFQCLSPLDQINLLKNLGRLDHKMSKFDSSIKFYLQLLELLKQSKELNDLQVSEVYQMLGSAYFFQGDYKAALQYYDESLKKKEQLKDSIEKEEIADLLVYIGLVKKHLQQYQSSLENYEKALEIINYNKEKNLKRISCIKKNIGTVYDHLQNNSQSIQYLEGALQDMIQAYGTENERVVNCLNKLGIVLVHSGQHNHEAAIQQFERAMKIMKKLYKMDTINESHRKQFRFKDDQEEEEISPLYKRALQVNEDAYILYRQVYDYFHVGVGIILEIRGMIYHFLNKFNFALKYYTEANQIYGVILKPEHEFVKRSKAFIQMSKVEKKFQNFPKL